MARFETVVGATALSASLATGSGLIQLEEVGGFQTFNSSSYNIGRTPPDEFLRPDSDITATNWGPLALFSQLNEATADGAITEITSSAVSSISPVTSSRLFEVGLSLAGPTDVVSATVRFTAAKSGAFSADTGSAGDSTASVSLSLVEGSTIRAQRTFIDIGTDFELLDFALTDIEIASVDGWQNVAVRGDFDLSVSTGSSTVNGRCTHIEVQLGVSSVLKAPPVDNRVFRLTWES